MGTDPKGQSPSSASVKKLKVSARKATKEIARLCQGDILEKFEIIEDVEIIEDKIKLHRLTFPYVVCLNQECDLEQDFGVVEGRTTSNRLLHIAVAPAFVFEQYLAGNHWADIFAPAAGLKRDSTLGQKIVDNEIPRFHYLNFAEPSMPELVIDFKHFFTISRAQAYRCIGRRLTSIDDLFREKINHRFSYYISRIGLPEV